MGRAERHEPAEEKQHQKPEEGMSLVEKFNKDGWPSPKDTLAVFRSTSHRARFPRELKREDIKEKSKAAKQRRNK